MVEVRTALKGITLAMSESFFGDLFETTG